MPFLLLSSHCEIRDDGGIFYSFKSVRNLLYIAMQV
jgi:hypothetical protein